MLQNDEQNSTATANLYCPFGFCDLFIDRLTVRLADGFVDVEGQYWMQNTDITKLRQLRGVRRHPFGVIGRSGV